jgi:hypothetical protein
LHLVGFTVEIYHEARSYKRQIRILPWKRSTTATSVVSHDTAYSQILERRRLNFVAFLKLRPCGLLDTHWGLRRFNTTIFRFKELINFKLILKYGFEILCFEIFLLRHQGLEHMPPDAPQPIGLLCDGWRLIIHPNNPG